MLRSLARAVVLLLPALFAGCAQQNTVPVASPNSAALAQLRQQVIEHERAFAATMAARDHAGFVTYLADDSIFLSGTSSLRGKAEVAAGWRPYFDGANAPFSWQPEQVEVQANGALALSSGPVFDPSGKLIARFTSIWQQQAPGVWRVVFDRGNPVCPPPTTP